MGDSDNRAVLVVSGLVVGVYNFTLTVTNRNNLSSSATVVVTVLPPPMLHYMIQLVLELDRKDLNDSNAFTVADKVSALLWNTVQTSNATGYLLLCKLLDGHSVLNTISLKFSLGAASNWIYRAFFFFQFTIHLLYEYCYSM